MTIAYEEFEKVNLRSGTVVKAEPFERAKKPAYKVWVDFGDEIGDAGGIILSGHPLNH